MVLHQVPDPLSQGLLAVDDDAGRSLDRAGEAAHGPRTVALAVAAEVVQRQVVAEGPGQDHEPIDVAGTGEVVDDVVPLAEAERRPPRAMTGEEDEIDAGFARRLHQTPDDGALVLAFQPVRQDAERRGASQRL